MYEWRGMMDLGSNQRVYVEGCPFGRRMGLVEPEVGSLSGLLDYLDPALLTGKSVCEACWTVWVWP